MKSTILKKLSSQVGESIGETLVALLISALALLMLAGAVSSGMRVVTRSKDAMDGYYTVNNALASRETAKPIVNDAAVEVFFPNALNVRISGLKPQNDEVTVNYWKNTTISKKPVIAYAKPTPAP